VWRVEAAELKVELWPTGDLELADDVLRRDYTINALSWSLPGGPLVDLAGGLDDLAERRLRAISRANLEDDPVRMIRAPRFLAQLSDFQLDHESREWIAARAPKLARAPRERVGQELLSLLRAPHSSRGLHHCLELGLLEPAAPQGSTADARWLTRHVGAGDRLARDRFGGDAARLGLLLRAWGAPPAKRLAPYSWPKTERDAALLAAGKLDDAIETVDAPAADRREFVWRTGDAFPALLALATAIEPGLPGWRRWRRQWRQNHKDLVDPTPLLTGAEIAVLAGIEPGPELGALVERLIRAQVRREVRTRSAAMRWLRRAMDELT
jgi:tRNA nucleotidyltransferase/poly(A) polymerase